MQKPAATPVISTGITGLDEIFLGGVAAGNSILVEGAPGTGKTTCGLQFIYEGAVSAGDPGLIVAFELDEAKILRDAAGFGWHLDQQIDAGMIRVVQTSPAVLWQELRESDGVLSAEIAEIGAKRLLIDSITPLQLYAESAGQSYRSDVYLLVESLARLGVTSLVTAERISGALEGGEADRFLFDTVIRLGTHHKNRNMRRSVEIVKSRGQDFIGGEHTLRISGDDGVSVYRRAQSKPRTAPEQPASSERISTGCEGLDRAMDGGLYRGAVTLVTGISGTGKTVAGIQFLVNNLSAGNTGLLITLDEQPQQMIRNAATLGYDLQAAIDRGQLLIHYESPLELELDVHFETVKHLVEQIDARCVVFDSVAAYETAEPDGVTDFLYVLATYLKSRLATVYMNYESPELLGISQISEELKGSHLVDNILLLNYVEVSTQLRRAITVPKVRGSNNLQVTQEYVIGPGGIRIVEEPEGQPSSGSVPQLPFSAYYGLLSRSPSRQSPLIQEAINSGDPLPPSTGEHADSDT